MIPVGKRSTSEMKAQVRDWLDEADKGAMLQSSGGVWSEKNGGELE
jgi:hypothetical protein